MLSSPRVSTPHSARATDGEGVGKQPQSYRPDAFRRRGICSNGFGNCEQAPPHAAQAPGPGLSFFSRRQNRGYSQGAPSIRFGRKNCCDGDIPSVMASMCASGLRSHAPRIGFSNRRQSEGRSYGPASIRFGCEDRCERAYSLGHGKQVRPLEGQIAVWEVSSIAARARAALTVPRLSGSGVKTAVKEHIPSVTANKYGRLKASEDRRERAHSFGHGEQVRPLGGPDCSLGSVFDRRQSEGRSQGHSSIRFGCGCRCRGHEPHAPALPAPYTTNIDGIGVLPKAIACLQRGGEVRQGCLTPAPTTTRYSWSDCQILGLDNDEFSCSAESPTRSEPRRPTLTRIKDAL